MSCQCDIDKEVCKRQPVRGAIFSSSHHRSSLNIRRKQCGQIRASGSEGNTSSRNRLASSKRSRFLRRLHNADKALHGKESHNSTQFSTEPRESKPGASRL